ncbi:hypothetical protein AMIS_12750 [Actinoplanes missouriensis 431]|uniref:Uncharacterized protein n=1 Tax=Actinoplanes missouriensis (strain ATCC 14538 / DSM 43046 / CBS 188.64 / JCM 3121 / NBRC 102363 / NCIMB 12654 / NRRL B-3342 / UNCC 431) TaxID=512565 RepID=I0H0F8_ACTM4|nr:hypothetical protein AMIS_12750 [Actinoplanes missouriensis 431]
MAVYYLMGSPCLTWLCLNELCLNELCLNELCLTERGRRLAEAT